MTRRRDATVATARTTGSETRAGAARLSLRSHAASASSGSCFRRNRTGQPRSHAPGSSKVQRRCGSANENAWPVRQVGRKGVNEGPDGPGRAVGSSGWPGFPSRKAEVAAVRHGVAPGNPYGHASPGSPPRRVAHHRSSTAAPGDGQAIRRLPVSRSTLPVRPRAPFLPGPDARGGGRRTPDPRCHGTALASGAAWRGPAPRSSTPVSRTVSAWSAGRVRSTSGRCRPSRPADPSSRSGAGCAPRAAAPGSR